ncbi:MAG: stage 0 sporulation family protein [Clostridia bacterium]|nr:stage 0 sporulation family protein [Clostridia bacterium]
MVEIVGVRFKKVGKTYYFAPNGISLKVGDNVIVETARGVEFGEIVIENREIPDEAITTPLKPVVCKATEADCKQVEENKKKEKKAFEIFVEKASKHKLDMKLVDVEYTFDGSKISFFFTADGRIDFRELVKELASTFRTRIELRQIGVRDEAKTLGGIGICGRELCCKGFLGEFIPVSIKMAKEQNLSLNPTKISGACGRLMCCLKYEQEAYEDLGKKMPRNGAIVQTPDGKGTVININLIRQTADVRLESNDNIKQYNGQDVKVLKNTDAKIDKETLNELKGLED